MVNPKISMLIVSMLVVVLFVTVFMNTGVQIKQNYSGEFDNSTLREFEALEPLQKNIQELENRSLGLKQKTGILDVIGGFFSDGYAVLKLSKSSLDVTYNMTQQTTENIPLGNNAGVFRVIITSILLVIFIIGIILSAVIKREM